MPDRWLLVPVRPAQVTGEDVSPGVKRGGWVNVVQRTVRVSCRGDAILPHIEVWRIKLRKQHTRCAQQSCSCLLDTGA